MKEGLYQQAAGWEKIEAATKGGEEGQLANVLRHLKMQVEVDINVKKEEGEGVVPEKAAPISVKLESGKYVYQCPICPNERRNKTRNGMWAHIREFHTHAVLSCSWCAFTCYNNDTMASHECRKH